LIVQKHYLKMKKLTLKGGIITFSFFVVFFLVESICFSCKTVVVRGNSMSPMFLDGQKIKIFQDYYNNHSIKKRGDVVLVKYSRNNNLLLKIIKGIPNDSFSLLETGREDNKWNILINGEIVKNSIGYEYVIGGHKYKMLKSYVDDYKGKIPKNAYLVLGDNLDSSIDSTVFGLIDFSNIITKVDL